MEKRGKEERKDFGGNLVNKSKFKGKNGNEKSVKRRSNAGNGMDCNFGELWGSRIGIKSSGSFVINPNLPNFVQNQAQIRNLPN